MSKMTILFVGAALLSLTLVASARAQNNDDEPVSSETAAPATNDPADAPDADARKGVPRTEPGCIRACKGEQKGREEARKPSPPAEPPPQADDPEADDPE